MSTAIPTVQSGPTPEQYDSLQKAFDALNLDLFGGSLPRVLITLQRSRKAYGYFYAEGFEHRLSHRRTDEIALNPDTFYGRSDAQILSTLAHEMVHLWQHRYGRPSPGGYHNAQWADKMERIGLMPLEAAARAAGALGRT